MNTLLAAIRTSLLANLDKRDCQYIFIGNPESLPKQVLEKGVCIIAPDSTSPQVITTGVQFMDTKRLKLIFAKSIQNDFNTSAQSESATEWLMRIMEGRNPDGSPKSSCALTIVLSNLKRWGVLQGTVRVNYGTKDLRTTAGGVAMGNISMEQKDIYTILLN